MKFESAPTESFFEKGKKWIESNNETLLHSWKDITLRTLVAVTSLTFAQQDIEHVKSGGRFDYKTSIGFGLHLRSKGGLEAQEKITQAYYESKNL